MRRQGFIWGALRRRTVVAVTLATGAAVAMSTPAVAAPGSSLAQPFAATTAHTVTLITGDQVTLYPAGHGTTNYAIRPAPGSGGFESFQASNGDRYVIPASVIPYLGQLDRSLFDVSALATAGTDATLPVRLSFAAGVTPSAPEGVTLTSVGATTATGYLTPASEPAFAAALRKQIGADVAAGRRAGTSPLFGGVTGISLATTAPGGGVQPRYPLHILQINATDINGQPAQNANVALMNTDMSSKELNNVPVAGGIGRIAVPAGNYTAIATFVDFDANGNLTALRMVTLGDFTVADSTSPSAVTVDERTATSQVTATSPKPAVQDLVAATVVRMDATGNGGISYSLSNQGSSGGVYVNPVPTVAVGSLHYAVQWGGSAPNPADHYRVDLAFAADNIPADETFVGKPDQLASVRENLYSDPASAAMQGTLVSGAFDPVLAKVGYGLYGANVPTPASLTDYLGTADSGGWQQYEISPSLVFMQSDPRTVTAGRHYAVDWDRGPVAAGLGQWNSPQFCDACSAGNTLSLAIPMFRDSEPDHTGFPFSNATVHFTLYQGNTVLFDRNNYYGASVTVPQTPATYRGVLDLDQTTVPGVSQAVKTHTEETVQYDPTATSAPLPSTSACARQTATAPCEILGAITVGYQLHADMTNTSDSPVQVLGLHVGHVAYNGVGSHSPIESATVSVSFDNGTTWHEVPVVGRHGNYTAVWPNPKSAAGTSPWLKVTASDAAGDAFSQTITNAYTIAKSSN